MDKFIITMTVLTTSLYTSMSMFPCMLADTTLITEVDELEITVPQLECVSGCSLLPITTLTCHIMEEEKEELVMSTIHLSGRPYHCNTLIQLPQNVEMLLHSLECQFCDSLEQLLVQNSCHVKYSLAEVDTFSWYNIMVAMVLMSILGILLVMLYREVVEVPERKEEDCLPIGGDVVTSKEHKKRGDGRREEEMFQQGHSLPGSKRRRSRSKRRK
jgi:hypothetical protein